MSPNLHRLLDLRLTEQGHAPLTYPEDGIFTLTVGERFLVNLMESPDTGDIRFFSSPGKLSAAALDAYWDGAYDPLAGSGDEPGLRWFRSLADDYDGVAILELRISADEFGGRGFDDCLGRFTLEHERLAEAIASSPLHAAQVDISESPAMLLNANLA